MDLATSIQINKQIMRLIEAKYPFGPSTWPNSQEYRYYCTLFKDTEQAEHALRHAGLATPVDTPF